MKPGKNERCPCGSGKKYKHCCERAGARAAPDAEMAGQLAAMAGARRYGDMESKARELIVQQPLSGFAWKALSVSLEMQGKDAFPALQRTAQLLPLDVEAQSNWGTALRRVGRLDEAISCFRRVLRIQPDIAEVWNNLGNALRDAGRLDEALAAFRRALDLKPDYAKSHNNLGNVLQDAGRLEEALESYRRALAIEPDYAEAHNNLALTLRQQNRPAEAEVCCRRALEIAPGLPAAMTLLAELSSDKGEFSSAEALFKRVIANQPESAEAWAGLAGLRKLTTEDAGWWVAAERIAGKRLPPRVEANLRYAIAKYHDDLGNYEQAFSNYRRANELTKLHRPGHDKSRLSKDIDRIIDFHTREWLRQAREDANPSERPLFIVGMPRSGTTLAEQILAAHTQVFGAGELAFWNAAAAAHASRLGGRNDAIILRKLAGDYLAALSNLSADALRIVDKMPANFLYLGMIHAALPNARVIHMRRNPLDTCLSIYFQNFGMAHSYANDLEDLAHYHTEYSRVMEHWRLVLPADALLDVPYEGLVDDPQAWGRRMVEFAGLSWEPNCLEFHRNDRGISTFSKWQARQKIHGSSVERWRNYEKYVGPLLRLTDAGNAGRLSSVCNI